jgi:hypothetical protein
VGGCADPWSKTLHLTTALGTYTLVYGTYTGVSGNFTAWWGCIDTGTTTETRDPTTGVCAPPGGGTSPFQFTVGAAPNYGFSQPICCETTSGPAGFYAQSCATSTKGPPPSIIFTSVTCLPVHATLTLPATITTACGLANFTFNNPHGTSGTLTE